VLGVSCGWIYTLEIVNMNYRVEEVHVGRRSCWESCGWMPLLVVVWLGLHVAGRVGGHLC